MFKKQKKFSTLKYKKNWSVLEFIFLEVVLFFSGLGAIFFSPLISYFSRTFTIKAPDLVRYARTRSNRNKNNFYYGYLHKLFKSDENQICSFNISGWAYDITKRKRLEVKLLVNGLEANTLNYKILRWDLFTVFKKTSSLFAGFEIHLLKDQFKDIPETRYELAAFDGKQKLTSLSLKLEFSGVSCRILTASGLELGYVEKTESLDFFYKTLKSNTTDRLYEVLSYVFQKKSLAHMQEAVDILESKKLDNENIFFKKAKVVDPSSSGQASIIDIEPASVFRFKSPDYYPAIKSYYINSPLVPIQLYHLKNVELLKANVVITKDQNYFLWDESARPTEKLTAGHWQLITKAKEDNAVFILKKFTEKVKLPKGILINGRCSSNYYHWMVEYLPRLLEIKKRPEYKDWPLIVEKNLPTSISESLRLFAEGHSIIEVDPEIFYQIEQIVIPSMLTFQPDDAELPFEETSGFRMQRLVEMKEFFLNHKADKQFPKKVFVGRRNQARSVFNDDEVFDVLKQQGFVNVDPTGLTLQEQITLFNEAEEIVLLAGAAVTNTMFCKKGCRVTCFVARRNGRHYAHKIMSDVSGADFTYILGEDLKIQPLYKDEYAYTHADYILDPKIIKKHLERANS